MTRIFASIAEALAGTAPTAVAPLSWNPVDHALSRLAFGPTAAARTAIAAQGIPAWYDDQVAVGRLQTGYGGNLAVAAQGPLLAMSPWVLRQYVEATGKTYSEEAMDQLARVTVGLQVWSDAQLYETLVDFFSNHLNVSNHIRGVWNTRHAYDRDVIRAHAMGSFTDMLLASARHPAMLFYLDLTRSSRKAVNENYGRELLELHTVGLVFSEADVLNTSYLLTGRKVGKDSAYAYVPGDHWTGPVRVLDFTHANSAAGDGEAGGDDLLRYLAAHPATAARLAHKLCLRYVSDDPSPELVAAVATAYLDSGTQILPMMSVLVRSEEFWASRGAKVRRPAENVVATARILDVRAEDMAKALTVLHALTKRVGHVPLDSVPPTGYPDDAGSWRSSGTMVNLWRLHQGLSAGWWKGTFAPDDRTGLYPGTPTTSGEALAGLVRRLTGTDLAPGHAAALLAYLREPAETPLASSGLRNRLPQVVALILDGPHHALR